MEQAALKYDFPQRKKGKPPKYIFPPYIDEMIRKLYREQYNPREGKVRDLAEKLNMPRWRISRRALEIGALEPRIKEPPWSERELHILELNALYTPAVIQRKLKAYGFKRSVYGIALKRKRMHYLQQQIKNSALAVAECFGVDNHTVTNQWIKKGLLKAKRRGTQRTESQGGDEWFIKDKDIRKFIIENIGIIDLRKVDKFWFVDILAGTNHLGEG